MEQTHLALKSYLKPEKNMNSGFLFTEYKLNTNENIMESRRSHFDDSSPNKSRPKSPRTPELFVKNSQNVSPMKRHFTPEEL